MDCWRCSYGNPMKHVRCGRCGEIPCCLAVNVTDGELICADCDLKQRAEERGVDPAIIKDEVRKFGLKVLR